MNVGELKKVISELDDDVFIELSVEYGFGEVVWGMKVGCYYDEKDKVLVFEGEEKEDDDE